MRLALINPNWSFEGSIYFGCREPHLPLEFGYALQLLKEAGHDAILIDSHMENLSHQEILDRLFPFQPEMIVLTTAPTYLFWRCSPPELRIPQELRATLRPLDCVFVVVGPHASTTPRATLKKLDADVALLGECEDLIVQLASTERAQWNRLDSLAYRTEDDVVIRGFPHATDLAELPPLKWPKTILHRHLHHHHRFDASPDAPGAEVEYSRGCPYHCTFCAKDNFRNSYRKRPIPIVMEEIDDAIAQGVSYFYFIDEIFLPDQSLLQEIAKRRIRFGIQTRIDLWGFDEIDILGKTGCVSIEAGIESISKQGREKLKKRCRLETAELSERLIHAKKSIPFVQGNLLESSADSAEAVQKWRDHLKAHGVWANEPVPLFKYPGSPEYIHAWGPPDDLAWERAVDRYLSDFRKFSDIQEVAPLPLHQLEREAK